MAEPETTPRWSILALDTGSSELEQSMLTFTSGFGQSEIPWIMWVLRGPTTIVADTSVPMRGRAEEFIGEQFSRERHQEPANALRDAAGPEGRGVRAADAPPLGPCRQLRPVPRGDRVRPAR
ncbi:MAG: hypothetical protein U0869_05040 [Chloroflexota bacterium]